MRIADKMNFEQVRANIGKNRSTMSELQNQAATQKRLNKPSDDPLAAGRVLASKKDYQDNVQFIKSLKYGKSFLDYTDQSLGDLSEVLMRAKELAISQANDASAGEETRRAVATEVGQLHAAAVAIGNRKLGDRFIFGGFKTQTPPFSPDGVYSGDAGEMNLHVDKEDFLAMNVPGGRVFLGEGLDAHGGAKPFPPQALDLAQLDQQKMERPGAFADPVRTENQIGEREAKPNQANGEKEKGPGQSAPGLRGPASVNGINIEPDRDEVAAGHNIFRALRDLEVSLRTNDKAGVQSSLEPLDQALDQVILTRSQVGSKGMTIDGLTNTLEKSKIDDQVQISELEDADIFATVSEINKAQATLQATLQTSGKLIQPSLMDFLR